MRFLSIPGHVARKGHLGRIVHRPDIDPGEIDRAIGRFLVEGDSLRLLKRDEKTAVLAGLGLGARPLCWKIFTSRRRGRRAFRSLADLFRRGVPVAEPFFLWERPPPAGGGAVVGMEDLTPRPQLDRWLSARLEAAADRRQAARRLRPLFAALGAAVRDLHARGVYLDDLKTCNIFLESEAIPSFRFIDVDRARAGRKVCLRRRAKNLSQLNRSTPIAAGLGCRHSFWEEYRRGLRAGESRKVRRAAIARSGERPVAYLSKKDTREEPWPARALDWPR
jgi:hypothetical protein